jgi:hypothetical protein
MGPFLKDLEMSVGSQDPTSLPVNTGQVVIWHNGDRISAPLSDLSSKGAFLLWETWVSLLGPMSQRGKLKAGK